MSKYTKGYWIVTKSGKAVTADDVLSFTPICTLEISPQHVTEEEYKANAKLIAAAPKLLEALIKCQYRLQTFTEGDAWEVEDKEAYELASEAIEFATESSKMKKGGTVKKAKGRPKKTASKKRKRFNSDL